MYTTVKTTYSMFRRFQTDVLSSLSTRHATLSQQQFAARSASDLRGVKNGCMGRASAQPLFPRLWTVSVSLDFIGL